MFKSWVVKYSIFGFITFLKLKNKKNDFKSDIKSREINLKERFEWEW